VRIRRGNPGTVNSRDSVSGSTDMLALVLSSPAVTSTAKTCGAIVAVMLTQHHASWPVAFGVTLLAGTTIGLLMGLLVARLGIPSFVVTLAFFLGLQGVQLHIIGLGGTIPISNQAVLDIMNSNMSVVRGWELFAIVVISYAAVTFLRIRRRASAGLVSESIAVWGLKTGSLAIVLGIGTYLLNQERAVNPELTSIKGVPYVVPVILVLLVVLTFVLQQTRFGRHIYAVGGNAEAARRAGLRVGGLALAAMAVGGALAGLGGLTQLAGAEFKLRSGFLAGYGYIGFLASWLARHKPIGVAISAIVLAAIVIGGDSLQIDSKLPAASVNVLMALTLLIVFGFGRKRVAS